MLVRKSPANTVARPAAGDRAPFTFIVGLPRSGTSLLTQMLDAHPDLALPLETRFFPTVVDRCQSAADPRNAFIDLMHAYPRWPSFQIDDRAFTDRIAQLDPFDPGAGLRVVYGMYAERRGKTRWGDKSPNHAYHMSLIQDVLPEARFIHIVRDGRDVALSARKAQIGPKSIQDAASWWTMLIWRARGQAENLRHYFELRYEDLVVSPEATLRQVCDFVDLPWNPAMLRFYEGFDARQAEANLSRPAEASQRERRTGVVPAGQLPGKPLQPDRIAVWRREMSSEDEREFEEVAGEMLQEFGYPLVGDIATDSQGAPR